MLLSCESMPAQFRPNRALLPQSIISSWKWARERIFLIVIEYWFENKQRQDSHLTDRPIFWMKSTINGSPVWDQAIDQDDTVSCAFSRYDCSSNIYRILANPFMSSPIKILSFWTGKRSVSGWSLPAVVWNLFSEAMLRRWKTTAVVFGTGYAWLVCDEEKKSQWCSLLTIYSE